MVVTKWVNIAYCWYKQRKGLIPTRLPINTNILLKKKGEQYHTGPLFKISQFLLVQLPLGAPKKMYPPLSVAIGRVDDETQYFLVQLLLNATDTILPPF